MSQQKENLINKTLKHTTFDVLKELVLLDPDKPEGFLGKIRQVEKSKDPEKIIELLPKELQEKYKEILVAVKNPIETGIRNYDHWLVTVQD